MTIPDDDTIQRELLLLIASLPEKKVLASDAYEQLAHLHLELTHEERTKKYANSVSKWANRVQFARLHLANRGLLYKARVGPNPRAGYWVITPRGEERAKVIIEKSGPSRDVFVLEKQVVADLEALAFEEHMEEGGRSAKLVAYYERNPALRASAIKLQGTTCKACGFNYERAYGAQGKDYIEVHHLIPISTYIEPTTINPATDLTVLCSNCHRMIHRNKNSPLSLGQLMEIVKQHVDPIKR